MSLRADARTAGMIRRLIRAVLRRPQRRRDIATLYLMRTIPSATRLATGNPGSMPKRIANASQVTAPGVCGGRSVGAISRQQRARDVRIIGGVYVVIIRSSRVMLPGGLAPAEIHVEGDRITAVRPIGELSTEHSALSAEHPALRTEHPALSTEHSAL